MIKRLIALLIFPILTVYNLHSQSNELSIEGTIFIDSLATQDVVVSAFSKIDTVNVISNQDGRYWINGLSYSESEEIINLKILYIGYRTKLDSILIPQNNSVLRDLYLDEILSLDEVVVTSNSQRTYNDLNKLTYTFKRSDFIKNISGGEALNVVPTLSFEKSAGLKIDGDRNALVFVDGVETSIEGLNQIDAKQIDKVEVINNPSAKYGSEFSGGIINISLRETDSLYYMSRIRFGKGLILNSNSVSPSLSLKTNKFSFNGYLSYFDNRQKVEYNVLRSPGTDDFYQQKSYRRPLVNITSSEVSARYNLKDKDFLFLKGAYVLNSEEGVVDGYFSDMDNQEAPFKNDSKNSYEQYSVDGVYETQIAKNTLSTKFRWVRYQQKNSFTLDTNEGNDSQFSNAKSDFQELSGLTDYGINIFKNETRNPDTNVGFKFIKRLYDFLENDFYLDQIVLGSYFNSSFYFKKNLSMFMSLYYEHAINQNDTFSENNDYFLPSTTFNWTIDKKSSLEFSYVRRISRPNALDLNETEIFLNPGISQKGNQNLNPELRQIFSLRLGSSLKNNSYLTIRPFFEMRQDAILEEIQNSGSQLIYKKQNIGEVNSYGLSTSYSSRFFKLIRASFTTGYKYNQFNDVSVVNSGGTIYGNVFLSGNFLKDKLYVSLFGQFDTPSYTFVSKTKRNPYTSLTLSTNFFKDKLAVTLDYNDILRWSSNINTTIDQNGIDQLIHIKSKFSNLVFTLAYNFGDSFNTRSNVKTIENSDVKN